MSKQADDSCEFTAQIAKVGTLADGGIRLTLDLDESCIAEAALLLAYKREQAQGAGPVTVTVRPEP